MVAPINLREATMQPQCKRTDWAMRQFCDQMRAQVRTGHLTTTQAQHLLRERMVPPHVARRIVFGG